MLIQSALYLVLTILAVAFAQYVHHGVLYIDMLYVYLNVVLTSFISEPWLRNILLLVLLPLAAAGIPAGIYHLIKKKNMPYFLEITWFAWLILVLSNVLIR